MADPSTFGAPRPAWFTIVAHSTEFVDRPSCNEVVVYDDWIAGMTDARRGEM